MYKNRISHLSSLSLILTFEQYGDSVGSGPGDLQMVKKVVVTKGKYRDYWNEMQHSYGLGFIPYRLPRM